MVVMRQDVADHPEARRVLGAVHRGLARPEGQGLATALLRSLRNVEIRTHAGLHAGQGTAYDVSLRRLDAVIRRTLLGLYFLESGVPLPSTHSAVVYSADGLDDIEQDDRATLRQVVDSALGGIVRILGERVFVYAVHRFSEVPHATAWVFVVYNRVVFFGFTAPNQLHPDITPP